MNRVGFGQSSFALNSLGLSTPVASNPKLQADFTTGTYKSNGVDKTFAELFTFSRAGKAWLVKETGLQEYAADVPRLDDGLLIEQESTNLVNYSDFSDSWSLIRVNSAKVNDIFYRISQTTEEGYHGIRKTFQFNVGAYTVSTYHDTTQAPYLWFTDNAYAKYAISVDVTTGVVINKSVATGVSFVSANREALDSIYRQSVTLDFSSSVVSSVSLSGDVENNTPYLGGPFKSGTPLDVIDIGFFQLETGLHGSSYIKTTTSPVTRPADYLLNNITGTTVTGDWDSTLNLSIVNGQLVHSGYGRIRSLEIN